MSDQKQITITLEGYDVDQINDRIGRQLMKDYEISVYEIFEREVSKALSSIITDTVDETLTKIVHDALAKGLIVSEKFEETVERKPVEQVVLEEATAWMTKKQTNQHGQTVYANLVRDIIGKELQKQTSEILRGVKKEAIVEAQKNISQIVAERLFDGRAALPGIR
jgi:predicted DNA-binding protein (UPF0278 family)